MLGAVKQLAAKAKSINQNSLVAEVFKDDLLQAQIVDLNQQQLYEEGIQADGTETGEYAYNTIYGTSKYAGKIEKNQRYDHVTLKDTGAFYKSMEVKVENDKIVMKAKDPNDLQTVYPAMLGLTEENINYIKPETKERFIHALKKELHS